MSLFPSPYLPALDFLLPFFSKSIKFSLRIYFLLSLHFQVPVFSPIGELFTYSVIIIHEALQFAMFVISEFYSTVSESAENISFFPLWSEIRSEEKKENTDCLCLCCQNQNKKNHVLSALMINCKKWDFSSDFTF